MSKNFERIKSNTEYKNPWYTGGYHLVKQPNGQTKKYYWAELPNAVTIVPILNDSIIMVKEYRPVTDKTYTSCPTGIVEPNESYEQTAKRELLEETNYKASKLNHIQSFDVATGILNHERGVVIAQKLEKQKIQDKYGEENEFIEVVRVNKDKAINIIREQTTNSATIEALLLAKEDGFL